MTVDLWVTPEQYTAREVILGMRRWALVQDDNLALLRTLPAASADSVICDPPYGLSKEPDMTEVLQHWLAGDDYVHRHGGFMGKSWDSFVPGPATWREVFRVLKPGGHLLAFGGTRTYDLVTIAVRMAGFEIRDGIAAWLQGQGFPKGPVLKPAWEPIVVARRPLIGTVVRNVALHGTGAMNIDECRVAGEVPSTIQGQSKHQQSGAMYTGRDQRDQKVFIGHAAGRWPPNVLFTHADGCVQVGSKKVRGDPREGLDGNRPGGFAQPGEPKGTTTPCARVYGDADGTETVEDWQCADECPVAELDRQSGTLKSGKATAAQLVNGGFAGSKNCYGTAAVGGTKECAGDEGGASRFFPCFKYVGKARRKERDAGCEDFYWRRTKGVGSGLVRVTQAVWEQLPERERAQGNAHPTVKPVELMAWLCRLVTPAGGVVVDHFGGSGTTGIGAIQEGFRFIGIEQDAPYVSIARARLLHAEGGRVTE